MPEANALQMGVECLKSQKVEEAIKYLEQATDQAPEDYRGFSYLGVAYAQNGMHNRAIGAFQAAARLKPGMASIHYNLGLAYQADGLHDMAREQLRRALEIDPGYAKAEEALRYMDSHEESDSGASCARHPGEPAVGECSFCRLPVCKECRVVVDDRVYCVKCAPAK